MKVHKYRCNVCGKIFGLDNIGWGITQEFEIENPRKVEDVHLCEDCILEIGRVAVKLNLLNLSEESGGTND